MYLPLSGCWCMFPSDRLTVFLRTGMPQAAQLHKWKRSLKVGHLFERLISNRPICSALTVLTEVP
jgi:hypothetical protein